MTQKPRNPEGGNQRPSGGISIGGSVVGSVVALGDHQRIEYGGKADPVGDAEARTPSQASGVLTRSTVRKLLNELLVTDSDFEAFCSDHFTDVYKRFGNNMDRIAKSTMLLNLINLNTIVQSLHSDHPEAGSRLLPLLQPTG